MNEETDFQALTHSGGLLRGPGPIFTLAWGDLGRTRGAGVVGDAHIRARGQLTASCCGVILGRISRLGCGPAPGNPHTREAEGNLRRRTHPTLIESPPCDHWDINVKFSGIGRSS